MKRGGPLRRRTPLRNKKPFRPNYPAADALMGIWGLKRSKASPQRREPKPVKRMPRVKKSRCGALERECDHLFRTAVKLRDGHKSVMSGLAGVIECAHIFTRSRHSTRWLLDNAVTLLKSEHQYFTDRPSEFMAWVRLYFGDRVPTVDDLERLSLQRQPVTEAFLIDVRNELRSAIQSLKDARHGCD